MVSVSRTGGQAVVRLPCDVHAYYDWRDAYIGKMDVRSQRRAHVSSRFARRMHVSTAPCLEMLRIWESRAALTAAPNPLSRLVRSCAVRLLCATWPRAC